MKKIKGEPIQEALRYLVTLDKRDQFTIKRMAVLAECIDLADTKIDHIAEILGFTRDDVRWHSAILQRQNLVLIVETRDEETKFRTPENDHLILTKTGVTLIRKLTKFTLEN